MYHLILCQDIPPHFFLKKKKSTSIPEKEDSLVLTYNLTETFILLYCTWVAYAIVTTEGNRDHL